MGFKTFRNGLDAEVEALRENTERELFLEFGGEDMVDGERVGLPVLYPRTLADWLSRPLRAPCQIQPRTREGLSRLGVTHRYP